MDNRKNIDTTKGLDYNNYIKPNPKYKDSLFCDLFGNPENKKAMLSLYNAVNGTDYTNADDIEVKTLKNVIYAKMKNDVAFLFDLRMNLYEHQSTVNPNMPLRGLLYMAEEYSMMYWADNSEIYGKKLIRIPAPKYVVFYNGIEEQPERYEMKLSDAFEVPSPGYEWTAFVLNINYGKNKELMEKCKELGGYSQLIWKIRNYQKEGYDMKTATTLAVDDCIREGIIADYLRQNRNTAIDSILCEYDEEKVSLLREQQAEQEGREKGKMEGKIEGTVLLLADMINDGEISLDNAVQRAKMSVTEFLQKAKEFGNPIRTV